MKAGRPTKNIACIVTTFHSPKRMCMGKGGSNDPSAAESANVIDNMSA
jgi:hypothetical protein